MAEYLSTHTGLRVDEAIAKIPAGNPGDKSVIVVNTDGKPEYAPATTGVAPNTVPIRDTAGRIQVADGVSDSDAANYGQIKKYADDNFVKARTNVTGESFVLYGASAGNPSDGVEMALTAIPYAVPRRVANGQIFVGTPTEDLHAVNKQYFDTNVTTFSVEVW